MQENEIYPLKYIVESVEKIETPEGMPAGNWFRYVISHGKSKIDGTKPGTLKGVTKHAEAMVDDLNIRAKNNRSTYAPTQNKHKKSSTSKDPKDS